MVKKVKNFNIDESSYRNNVFRDIRKDPEDFT